MTFLDTLEDMPDDAWDVSEIHNGKVMAWVEPNGSLYDLYIGGEDGIWADTSCRELFAGYRNTEYFAFGDAFHTEHAQYMDYMFYDCESLTSLDLSSFDTANVQYMNHMFYNCMSLSDLTLGDRFVTTNATTYDMFAFCPGGKDYQHLLN